MHPEEHWIAIGTLEGDIYLIRDGSIIRCIKKAHRGGVTAIKISKRDKHIISGGYDNTIKVHGNKSGALLKTLEGHKAVINDLIISPKDENVIYSCGADGTVITWDLKASNSIKEIVKLKPNNLKVISIKTMFTRNDEDLYAIADSVYRIKNGKFIPVIMDNKGGHSSNLFIIDGVQSPKESHVYLISSSDDRIYAYKWVDNAKLDFDHAMLTDQSNLIGIRIHQKLNVIATFDELNMIKLWK